MNELENTVKKLEVGKEYTYKELCRLLGEKEAKNREKQKTRWNRFFVFEQRGRLFYIVSIREVPLPDGRSKGNNRKYLDYCKEIVMFSLEKHHDMVYQTKNQWLLEYGVVHPELFGDYKELAKKYDCHLKNHTKFYVKNCQTDIADFIRNKFITAIKSLEKSGFLNLHETYHIVEDGKAARVASDIEKQEIAVVEQKVLEEMQLKSFKDAKYKNKDKELRRKINACLSELYGFKYVYKVLGLQSLCGKQYKYSVENVTTARSQLMPLLVDGLKKHFINKGENGIKRVAEQKQVFYEHWLADEDTSNDRFSFDFEEDYAENMLRIMDSFLSL